MRTRSFFGAVAILALAAADGHAGDSKGALPPELIDIGGIGLRISDITADGTTVSGLSNGGFVFRWTQDGGLENLGSSGTAGKANLSTDGGIVSAPIANGEGIFEAARREEGGDWQLLGAVPGGAPAKQDLTLPYALSNNGQHVAGLAWLPAFRAYGFVWNAQDGMRALPPLFADRNSRANAVSDDGRVVAGWGENEFGWWMGLRWVDGVPQALTNDEGDYIGEVVACSTDCSVMTGINYSETDPVTGSQAYRWTVDGVEALGVVDGSPADALYVPYAMTSDGRVIVGEYYYHDGFGFVWNPFRWSATDGMQNLRSYLDELGVIGGDAWTDLAPTAISDDGSTLAGWGFRSADGSIGSWYVRLPRGDAIFANGFEP